MSIQRWDPFRDVLRLRDAMDRLLEESFVRPTSITPTAALGMPLDVEETDHEYTIRASLPGFKPEEINVSLQGDVLTISGQHKGEEERREQNYLIRERRMGSVSRTVTLPSRVQADQAKAEYENGELVLTLPKAEEARPKQIQINVGGQQQLSGGQQTATSEQPQQ